MDYGNWEKVNFTTSAGVTILTNASFIHLGELYLNATSPLRFVSLGGGAGNASSTLSILRQNQFDKTAVIYFIGPAPINLITYETNPAENSHHPWTIVNTTLTANGGGNVVSFSNWYTAKGILTLVDGADIFVNVSAFIYFDEIRVVVSPENAAAARDGRLKSTFTNRATNLYVTILQPLQAEFELINSKSNLYTTVIFYSGIPASPFPFSFGVTGISATVAISFNSGSDTINRNVSSTEMSGPLRFLVPASTATVVWNVASPIGRDIEVVGAGLLDVQPASLRILGSITLFEGSGLRKAGPVAWKLSIAGTCTMIGAPTAQVGPTRWLAGASTCNEFILRGGYTSITTYVWCSARLTPSLPSPSTNDFPFPVLFSCFLFPSLIWG